MSVVQMSSFKELLVANRVDCCKVLSLCRAKVNVRVNVHGDPPKRAQTRQSIIPVIAPSKLFCCPLTFKSSTPSTRNCRPTPHTTQSVARFPFFWSISAFACD